MKAVIISMLKEYHAIFIFAHFELPGGEEELILPGSTFRSSRGISKLASCKSAPISL